jgi:predicted Zn-dependent protease with MMP-like domain
MTDDKIKEAFRSYANEAITQVVSDFSEEMFVEWEGNFQTKFEAAGFYAGCRVTERLVLEEVKKRFEMLNSMDAVENTASIYLINTMLAELEAKE